MIAMILAAGRGKRMGALTADCPKPLLSLGDETLIGRQLRLLGRAGCREVVINLSYRGERIRDVVGTGDDYGLAVRYSQEPEPPLETAGAIVAALPLLGDRPFLLVNADVVSDFDYRWLVAGEHAGLGTLVLVQNPPHHSRGDFGIDPAGRLCHDEPRYTFSGLSRLSPALFAGLSPGRRPLIEVLNAGIESGELRGRLHEGQWLDVGTPERLGQARDLFRDRPETDRLRERGPG